MAYAWFHILRSVTIPKRFPGADSHRPLDDGAAVCGPGDDRFCRAFGLSAAGHRGCRAVECSGLPGDNVGERLLRRTAARLDPMIEPDPWPYRTRRSLSPALLERWRSRALVARVSTKSRFGDTADEIVVEAKRTDRRGEVFGQRQSGDLNAFNRGRVPFWSDARRDGEQVLLLQEPTPGFTRIPKYERFYVAAGPQP